MSESSSLIDRTFINENDHTHQHETNGTTIDGFCFTCACLYLINPIQLPLRKRRIAKLMLNKLHFISPLITQSIQHIIVSSCIDLLSNDSIDQETVEILVECQSIFLNAIQTSTSILSSHVRSVLNVLRRNDSAVNGYLLTMLCEWFNVPDTSYYVETDTHNTWVALVETVIKTLSISDNDKSTSCIMYILLRLVQNCQCDKYSK
jgi:hypothetical protein